VNDIDKSVSALCGKLCSEVGIKTRLQVGRSGARIPEGTIDFSLLHDVQTGSGTLPAGYSVATATISRG